MINVKKTIIITGASSGLGMALAINYSKTPCRLFLFGRNKNRLSTVQNICKRNGAETSVINADIREQGHIRNHLENIIYEYGVDCIIACAGVSAGTLTGMETASQISKIFEVNFDGVINTILPAIPFMISKQKGNIVIISSMAGLLGLASAPSYSASKGAVRIFGQALRGYLKKYKVNVSIVIPGYIKTPMTEVNSFPMPFLMEADKAAKIIIKGLEKNKGIIAFPLTMYLFMKFLNLLPQFIIDYLNSKLPGKPAFDQ